MVNNMKITVIGATGMAGSKIVKEALDRGHEVVGISRTEVKLNRLSDDSKYSYIAKDVADISEDDLRDSDAIVDAFATAPDTSYLHIDLATKLIAMFRESNSPRLVFILGAGSLMTGNDNHLLLQEMEQDPTNAKFISIPRNQAKELNFLKDVDDVNWVGISPSNTFEPGDANENGYLVDDDHLITNQSGQSRTTSGTMANAVLDEIEHPQHMKRRFTVAEK